MRCSRRAFLEAGLALPAVLHSAPEPGGWRSSGPAFSQDSSFDPWVEIHAENLRHNVTEISRRVSVRPILAVIKNNGYGLGVVNVAQLLEPQPEIFGFAVVKLHEAFSLRDAGIRKPILLLDRKSTRLNSSHGYISYAVFCLKKKNKRHMSRAPTHQQAPPGTVTDEHVFVEHDPPP